MSIFATKLRTLVSQDRMRHEELSVNIDLTYITDRILAMSFPATGIEAAWRNDIQDVCRLLQAKHKNSFLVYNLSERHYEYDLLDNQIVCFPFKDHHAPPLHIIFQIIFNIDKWLKANDQHVAIVHCIGGKGRTGLIIVCYLFYSGMFPDVDKCLEYFASRRSAKGKGVTQPSQLRYVRYFCGIISNKLQISLNPLTLTKVTVGPIPKGYYVFVEFFPQLYAETNTAYVDGVQDQLIFSTFANPESRTLTDDGRYTTDCDVELSGDILVRGYLVGQKEGLKGKTLMFRMQFHTGLVHRGEVAIPKSQLDDLDKEKKKFQDFELRLTFENIDSTRNSIAMYNMIFNQMRVAFDEQQQKKAEGAVGSPNGADKPENKGEFSKSADARVDKQEELDKKEGKAIKHKDRSPRFTIVGGHKSMQVHSAPELTRAGSPPLSSSSSSSISPTSPTAISRTITSPAITSPSKPSSTKNSSTTTTSPTLPMNTKLNSLSINSPSPFARELPPSTEPNPRANHATPPPPPSLSEDDKRIEELLVSLEDQLITANKRHSRIIYKPKFGRSAIYLEPPPLPSFASFSSKVNSNTPTIPSSSTATISSTSSTSTSPVDISSNTGSLSHSASAIPTSFAASPPIRSTSAPSSPLTVLPSPLSSSSATSPSNNHVSLLSRSPSLGSAHFTKDPAMRGDAQHDSPRDPLREPPRRSQQEPSWKDSVPSAWGADLSPRSGWRVSSPYPTRTNSVVQIAANPNPNTQVRTTRTSSRTSSSSRASSPDSVLDSSQDSASSLGSSMDEIDHFQNEASRRMEALNTQRNGKSSRE